MLNGTIPQIRGKINSLSQSVRDNHQLWSAKAILTMTEEEWSTLDPAKKNMFDAQSAILLLLLRKEFGQHNLHHFWSSSGDDIALQGIYKFSGYDEFGKTYARYMTHLVQEIANKTPNSYLQITKVSSD